MAVTGPHHRPPHIRCRAHTPEQTAGKLAAERTLPAGGSCPPAPAPEAPACSAFSHPCVPGGFSWPRCGGAGTSGPCVRPRSPPHAGQGGALPHPRDRRPGWAWAPAFCRAPEVSSAARAEDDGWAMGPGRPPALWLPPPASPRLMSGRFASKGGGAACPPPSRPVAADSQKGPRPLTGRSDWPRKPQHQGLGSERCGITCPQASRICPRPDEAQRPSLPCCWA